MERASATPSLAVVQVALPLASATAGTAGNRPPAVGGVDAAGGTGPGDRGGPGTVLPNVDGLERARQRGCARGLVDHLRERGAGRGRVVGIATIIGDDGVRSRPLGLAVVQVANLLPSFPLLRATAATAS